MSSTSNPIQWTWPDPGEDEPPFAVESNFGPVSKNDSMVLTFTPASYTGILILYCSWQDGQQGITWTIYNNKGSPFTYNFNETTPNGSDLNDEHVCHFLQPTNKGNTQTFQYLNAPAKSSVLWQQSGESVILPSSSSSSSSGLPTSSATSLPASTSSAAAAPPAASSSGSHALSVGAAIGITIGAIVVLLALGALGFIARRRVRRRRQGGAPMPLPNEWTHGDGAQPMTRSSMKRVGELDGQSRSEMDGIHTAQPPPAYPNELPGEARAELPGE